MDKSNWLKELAQLKSLIHEHETLQKSNSSQCTKKKTSPVQLGNTVQSTLKDSRRTQNPPSQSYNVIYVNPNKLGQNAVKAKTISNGLSSATVMKQQMTLGTNDDKLIKRSSVFINPNFKKPPSSHQGGPSLPNDTRYATNKNKSSSFSQLKHDTIPKAVREQYNTNCPNKKIFVNPQFNLPESKLKCITKRVVIPMVLESKVATTPSTTALNSNSDINNLTSLHNNLQHANLKIVPNQNSSCSRKRKIEESNQSLERSVVHDTGKILKVTNPKESGKRIFLNPLFKNELNINVNPGQNVRIGAAKFPAVSQTSTSSIPVPISNQVAPIINHNYRRRRSSSSNLVSISATKLIRKRKLSQGSSIRKSLKKTPPVYLSKTKLVRNNASSGVKNIPLLNQTIVKRAVPKTQLQFLNADKVKRLRKQSFSNSITNLINIIPTSTTVTKVNSKNCRSLKLIRKPLDSSVILRVKSGDGKTLKLIRNPEDLTTVTKIKSNNGKTLKLIRKTKDLNKLLHEKGFDKNRLQRRNQIHLQQASKRAHYFLKNKWKQNKFSKINQPSTGKLITNSNKYVIERNKSLTKYVPYKLKVENSLTSTNINSKKLASSSGKIESSKYKLIRKLTCDLGNTSKHYKKKSIDLGNKPSPSTSNKKKQKKVLKPLQRKQLSIVNIGGVFYRCTRTSLCKNKTSSVKDQNTKGPLLKIRGQNFQLDDNGNTLKCLDSKHGRQRIDIGGVTFISSSSGNSLTRTNYHTARSILTQAKQKSLSLHVNKLRKNNEPCPFFHRFGRCAGKERGTCIRKHDQKFVAVCKKFVSGTCKDEKCLLSHVTSMHNMPTCQHYLAGQCARDSCPYLHVKLSDSSPLCIDFLKGFCSRGDQCTKRHLELCPSFEKGACPRGKSCPYPHPKSCKKRKGIVKPTVKRKPPQPSMEHKAVSINVRYFEDIKLQEEYKIQLEEEPEDRCSDGKTSETEETVHRLKTRPKVGSLPSFIPLMMNNSCSGSEEDLGA